MKVRLLKLAAVVLFLAVAGVFIVSNAEAARCTVDGGGNVSCTNNSTTQWYWWGLSYIPRPVHWQVPEGTAPSGGWPVVYWFEGTSPVYDNYVFSPFVRNYADVFGDLFGLVNEAMTVRTLLDDVYGTGKKYAVIAPAPPLSTLLMQFWNTNCVFPYSISADYYFFNTLFPKVDSGNYGNVNNSRRFASGVSSGGYNTSRMAITFNSGNKFRALAVQSASYADCSGPACALPCSGTAFIPANHPPTKFYHGVFDPIVPIVTMYCYYNDLVNMGIPTTVDAFTNGGILGLHGYSTDSYDSVMGVQAYFNQYYNYHMVGTETAFGSSYLNPGQSLPTGKYLASPSGTYHFVNQYDGNFVLYHGTSAIWASNTMGQVTTKVIMQTDGNLVLYNGSSAVWASGTNGKGTSTLSVQNDGNAVIYQQSTGKAVWATNTSGK